MMLKLLKTYTLSVTIQEGDDEFWDDVRKQGLTGCDAILGTVKDALAAHGFDIPGCHVRLERFEERGPLGPVSSQKEPS